MYTAAQLHSARAGLEARIPREYISSVELWSVADFVQHLGSRYGLQPLIFWRDTRVESMYMFVWDPAEVGVYKSSMQDMETQLSLLRPFFPDGVYCYQMFQPDYATVAMIRVGFAAEVFFTLFDGLVDLGNISPDSFTFVEHASGRHWLVPHKYYPISILTNFPFGKESPASVQPSWIRALFALKLEEPPVKMYDLNLFSEGHGIDISQVCSVIQEYIIDWYFDRLLSDRASFSHPEAVLQVIVDLANDPDTGQLMYLDRYLSGPYSLNFHFCRLIFSLTARADCWTGMEDPDNQIAEIAEQYLGKIQRNFSAEAWKNRYG